MKLCDLDALKKAIVVEYRNTLRQLLDRGIVTYSHQIDALEYTISLIQKEIDGEVD